jgi:hypothetical protein
LKLSTDSAERKNTPIFSGVMNYFPLALAYVAKVSKAGNDKHNPGQPLHWARGKSTDHQDCIARHLIDYDGIDPDDGLLHAGKLAWRALALLETELEKRQPRQELDTTKHGPDGYELITIPPRPKREDYPMNSPGWCAWSADYRQWEREYGSLMRDAGQQVGSKPAPEDTEHGADCRDCPQ